MNAPQSSLPLVIDSVTKRFPGKTALDKLNLAVPAGQVLGLLGRNGAGKTTLLECVLGLRNVDEGSIRLFGTAPGALDDALRARIGYVPQETDLFEWMTARQMLDFFKAFYPHWNDAKVSALLDRWSITPTQVIGRMSGGEKQRLAIIRALAHDPDLLILDEPVASLDPAGRRDFLRELVERTIEHETTVVFSTHILSDLERVAMQAAFMREGKIVLQESLDVLAERTRRFIGPLSVLPANLFSQELNRRETGAGHVNVLARMSEADDEMMEKLSSAGVNAEPVGLEDLFIEVTQ